MIAANSYNSIMVPNTKAVFSQQRQFLKLGETRWRYTLLLTHPGLRSFSFHVRCRYKQLINAACSKNHPCWVYSEKHPLCHPWGAGKLLRSWRSPLPSPQFARVKLYLVLWKIWWRGSRVLQHCASDPFTLHKNNFGDRIASWSLIQYDQSCVSRSARKLLTVVTSSSPSRPSHHKQILQILPLAGNRRWRVWFWELVCLF